LKKHQCCQLRPVHAHLAINLSLPFVLVRTKAITSGNSRTQKGVVNYKLRALFSFN